MKRDTHGKFTKEGIEKLKGASFVNGMIGHSGMELKINEIINYLNQHEQEHKNHFLEVTKMVSGISAPPVSQEEVCECGHTRSFHLSYIDKDCCDHVCTCPHFTPKAEAKDDIELREKLDYKELRNNILDILGTITFLPDMGQVGVAALRTTLQKEADEIMNLIKSQSNP